MAHASLRALIFLGCLVCLCACDAISDARRRFQEGEIPEGHEGKLSLSIVPAENLEIEWSGEPLANASPFEARFMPEEPGILRIRAAGYRPFELPLTLSKDRVLHLNIQLEAVDTPPSEAQR